jgi:hypothetical protein
MCDSDHCEICDRFLWVEGVVVCSGCTKSTEEE